MTTKLTTEQFIDLFNEIHGDKYDYSKVASVHWKTKLTITCTEHGDFKQRVDHHKNGVGCPWCAGAGVPTTEQFIEQAKDIHNDRYDYSKVVYVNKDKKVIIICKKHGDFEQSPHNHKKGQGCRLCSSMAALTTDKFIEQSKVSHGDKYDYSKSVYVGAFKKLIITCKEHGDFPQNPNNHKNGAGCPLCSNGSTDNDALYLWQAINRDYNGLPVYKIGITSWKSVDTKGNCKRIKDVAKKSIMECEVIAIFNVNNARELEQEFHKIGINPNYTGFNGCTEFRALNNEELELLLTIASEAQTKTLTGE